MNKFWKSNVYHSEYSLWKYIPYLKLAERVDRKCPQYKKKSLTMQGN
jgi:hypothetical protein